MHCARRQPETRYAQSSSAKIAFRVSGTFPVDLVIAPRFVSHLELQCQNPSCRRFSQALARGCRLIQFDKHGTGLSDPTVGIPTIGARMEDVLSVMTAVRSPQAVVLGLIGRRPCRDRLRCVASRANARLILYGTSYGGPHTARMRAFALSAAVAVLQQSPEIPWRREAQPLPATGALQGSKTC